MSDQHDTNPLAPFEAELLRRERRERELEELWRMSPAERAAALLAGDMTIRQLSAWGERHPDQIPDDEQIKAAQDAALWAMNAEQRVAAMNAGRLTEYQLFSWSIRRPGEVPRIGGEFAWIVHRTADWIEAIERDTKGSREPARRRERLGE
jgi:hypothetical protein